MGYSPQGRKELNMPKQLSHCLGVCFGSREGESITGPRGYQASKAQASAVNIMPGAFPVEFQASARKVYEVQKGWGKKQGVFL